MIGQTSGEPNRISALPPKADFRATHRHVRFEPTGDEGPRFITLRGNRLLVIAEVLLATIGQTSGLCLPASSI